MNDKAFIKAVITHYRQSGRHDLSWRKKISPYKILVSEIMLQQTQVARVEEKFMLWMKQFPSLSRLSKATFTDVLKLWQGLGYQRRAKALYEISKSVKTLPRQYEELLALKGVGPYTASAVMAFAYDEFPPHLLETNIRTALIEAFHTKRKKVDDKILYEDLTRLHKEKIVQKIGARMWYYALMDYGAHLKVSRISHNTKSTHYKKQSLYKGSVRELRAKALFAIAHKKELPTDVRLKEILDQLKKEGYILQKGGVYIIV